MTLKVRRGLWSLRSRRVVSHVMRAIAAANANEDEFRLTQFSILDDHVHALVEARDNRVLSGHVQGIAVRVARAVNAAMRRTGRVFKDRFHARVLRTPTETRRALAYVLQNRAKHMAQLGRRIPSSWIDPLSSAAAFDGWPEPTLARYRGPPLPRARSWLLAVGWRRAGAIDADAPEPLRG